MLLLLLMLMQLCRWPLSSEDLTAAVDWNELLELAVGVVQISKSEETVGRSALAQVRLSVDCCYATVAEWHRHQCAGTVAAITAAEPLSCSNLQAP